MKKLLYLLVFYMIASCTTKRNPNLCKYFWLNDLDLEVGCITLTKDSYEGDDFLPDHSGYSEAIVDEKCEPKLIAYLEKSEDWQKGQISDSLITMLFISEKPTDYDYYYKLRYKAHILDIDNNYAHVDWRNLGFYDPKTKKISYSSFAM